MSDTPRTDAHTRQLIDTLQHPHWIEFARTLERENAALMKRLEYSDQWDDYNAIKALKAENAALKQQCETCETASVIDSYVRENAALQTDKERLDWMESQYANLRLSKVKGSGEELVATWATSKVRELIDAVRMDVQEERLKLENSALRADKERLDWLESLHANLRLSHIKGSCEVLVATWAAAQARRLIDAARKHSHD